MKAILMMRVSDKEQLKALPGQTYRVKDYAAKQQFEVIEEFEFDESAYKKNRD